MELVPDRTVTSVARLQAGKHPPFSANRSIFRQVPEERSRGAGIVHSHLAPSSEDAPSNSPCSICLNSEAVSLHGMRQLLWHILQRYLVRSINALGDSPHPRSGGIAMRMTSAGRVVFLTEPDLVPSGFPPTRRSGAGDPPGTNLHREGARCHASCREVVINGGEASQPRSASMAEAD